MKTDISDDILDEKGTEIFRENSFEAQRVDKIKCIARAYAILGDKIIDLENILHEEYCTNEDGSEAEETAVKKDLKEEISGLERYISELESEVSELDALISFRDEEYTGLAK